MRVEVLWLGCERVEANGFSVREVHMNLLHTRPVILEDETHIYADISTTYKHDI